MEAKIEIKRVKNLRTRSKIFKNRSRNRWTNQKMYWWTGLVKPTYLAGVGLIWLVWQLPWQTTWQGDIARWRGTRVDVVDWRAWKLQYCGWNLLATRGKWILNVFNGILMVQRGRWGWYMVWYDMYFILDEWVEEIWLFLSYNDIFFILMMIMFWFWWWLWFWLLGRCMWGLVCFNNGFD